MPVSNSLLSLHIQKLQAHEQVKRLIRVGKPRVVKVLEVNLPLVFYVKEHSPDTVYLGREHMDDIHLNPDPMAAVEEAWQRITRRADWPEIKWFEGLNQKPTRDWFQFQAQAVFDFEMARRMHDHNKRYVALSWSEGNPPKYWEDDTEEGLQYPWRNFREHYDKVFLSPGVGAVGVHEYAAPSVHSPGMIGAHILRFPGWYERARQELGKMPLTIVSEAIIDGGIQGPDGKPAPGKGWQHFMSWEQYAQECIFYDNACRDLGYVAAITLFNTGHWPGQWLTFDHIGPFLDWQTQHLVEQGFGPNPLLEKGGNEMTLPVRDVRNTLLRHPTNRYARGPLSRINGLVIHHSAITAPVTVWNLAKAFVNNFGWPGIAYQFYIDNEGVANWCLDLEEYGAHCYNHNNHTWGICVAGRFMSGVVPAPKQLSALTKVTQALIAQYPQIVNIWGHRELSATACPGWVGGFEKWKRSVLDEGPTEAEKLREQIRVLETRVGNLATSMETIRAETKRWA